MANIWDMLKAGAGGLGVGLLTGNPATGVQAGLGIYSGIRDRSNPQLDQAQQQAQANLQRLSQYADQQQQYQNQTRQQMAGAQQDLSGATSQFQNALGGQVGDFRSAVGNYQAQIPGYQQQFMPQGQNVIDPTQTGFYNQLQGQYNATTPGNFMPPEVRQAIYANAMQPLRDDYEMNQRQALETANAHGLLGSGSLGVRQGLLDKAFSQAGTQVANNITNQDFQTGLAQQTNLRQALLGLQGQSYDRSMGLENLRIGGAQAGLGAAGQGLQASQQLLGAQTGAAQAGLGAQQNLFGTYQTNANNAGNQFGQSLNALGQGTQNLYTMGQNQQAGADSQFRDLATTLGGAAQSYQMPEYLKNVAAMLKMPTQPSQSSAFPIAPAATGRSATSMGDAIGKYFGNRTF